MDSRLAKGINARLRFLAQPDDKTASPWLCFYSVVVCDHTDGTLTQVK